MILKLEFTQDVERITRVLLDYGFFVTPDKICEFWRWYSDKFAAGWLSLIIYSNVEIFSAFEDWVSDTQQEIQISD